MIRGEWLMSVGAAAGLAVSAYNYVSPVSLLAPDSSIDGTTGALLVVISTALLLVLSLVLRRLGDGALSTALLAVAFAGIALTTAAAHFLNSRILLAAMLVCLLGWCWRLVGRRRHA